VVLWKKIEKPMFSIHDDLPTNSNLNAIIHPSIASVQYFELDYEETKEQDSKANTRAVHNRSHTARLPGVVL
jgi:hypothetical protein